MISIPARIFARTLALALGAVLALTMVADSSEAAKRRPRRMVDDFVASNQADPGPGAVNFDFFQGADSGAGAVSMTFSASYKPGDIVVSFGDRRLYFVDDRGHALAYPIAIPREDARWAGTTVVSDKRVNPAWTPTPTMLAKNPNLPSFVPGGHPMNPLGVRALYLSGGSYRIHGTDAPWTIGTAASSGCIRMYNADAIDLYNRARVGARVIVTWNKFAG